jgi:23S rRNA (uridine2552-2'-O)-methyltransferase
MPKSDKRWLQRHVSDAYVREAKKQGYRSRAAFKLLEIDAKERLLRPGLTVIDLGAAPGGWSQVAAQKGAKVVAIDLLPVEPIAGVTIHKRDFREVTDLPAADVVLSDLSPNLSGIRNVDQARSLELLHAAVDVCRKTLKGDGAFLTKAFHGEAFDDVLEEAFSKVKVIKPAASRGESRETYFVCRNLTNNN